MKKILSKDRRVLDGYKKIGGKFVPPLVHQVGRFDYISWSTHTMPELLWWDVLADRVSNRFAVNVAEEIAKHLNAVKARKEWWGFISNIAELSADEMCGLKEHLRDTGVLDDVLESFDDFLNLYPECPVSRFLDHRPSGIADIGYISHFEDRVRELESKRSQRAVFIQAQVVYTGFMRGKLHVKRGLALADFPEVKLYPSTERSREVGASICATVNMLAGTGLPKYSEDPWVQYFWRRSLELKPLSFAHLEHQ